MSALGNLGNGNRDNLAGGRNAVSTSGGGFNSLTRWTGLGATMVDDLDTVKAKYQRLIESEKRKTAREEVAYRRAVREAEALAALDGLIDEIQG
jgi:hypothetical protein